MDGLGDFGAANFMRLWMANSGYPKAMNCEWATTGPGTRAGMNVLMGYPSVACLVVDIGVSACRGMLNCMKVWSI